MPLYIECRKAGRTPKRNSTILIFNTINQAEITFFNKKSAINKCDNTQSNLLNEFIYRMENNSNVLHIPKEALRTLRAFVI